MTRTFLQALPRTALFLLALLPVLIGGSILAAMWDGGTGTFSAPADILRRQSYPVAVVGHILGGIAMLMLGFTQFSASLRRRLPALHRWVGRGLVLAGTAIAVAALVMNASPHAQADSGLHDAAQNLMAVVYLAVLFLGFRAVRQHRIADHRAWMMRSYAITLGAATQTILLLPVVLLSGPPSGLSTDLAFISAWALNLGVAEWLIRGYGLRVRNGRANTAPNRS